MTAADNQLHRFLIETTLFKRRLGFKLPAGFHYYGPEDYVLDHGNPFVSAPLTLEEQELLWAAIESARMRFPIGHCFHNAQKLVLSDKTGTLRYVEGLAMGLSAFPVLHGWVSIHNKVVDLTWRKHTSIRKGRFRDRVLGEIPPIWAYNGVSFDPDSVCARWFQYGASFPFLDDIYHGFPIFQEPRLRPLADILEDVLDP